MRQTLSHPVSAACAVPSRAVAFMGAKGLKAQFFFTDATRWAWDCL
jgi:hypothetical protein